MSNPNLDIQKSIMDKISTGQVKMRPRWYFLLGSISLLIALISLSIFSIYSLSLVSFSLRTHGRMGEYRYQRLVSNFPYWSAILAILGITLGIYMLKKYDFSYRQNFLLIVTIFTLALIISGLLMDSWDRNLIWRGRGMLYEGLHRRGY